eukprot:3940391-Rhodomonas_salina.1
MSVSGKDVGKGAGERYLRTRALQREGNNSAGHGGGPAMSVRYVSTLCQYAMSVRYVSTGKEGTPRNQRQENALLVQIVLGLCVLVSDFAAEFKGKGPPKKVTALLQLKACYLVLLHRLLVPPSPALSTTSISPRGSTPPFISTAFNGEHHCSCHHTTRAVPA